MYYMLYDMRQKKRRNEKISYVSQWRKYGESEMK
jgi:hypothetical protein